MATFYELPSRAQDGKGRTLYQVSLDTPWLATNDKRCRRVFGLGVVSKRDARRFCDKVEALVNERLGRVTRSNETAAWVAKLDPKRRARLESLELLTPAQPEAEVAEPTVRDLCERFWTVQLAGVKNSTRTAYGNVRRELEEKLGDRTLRSLTVQDADEWRGWLVSKLNHKKKPHSRATVSRRVTFAKQLFRRAVAWELVTRSVFADLETGSQVNEERLEFVDREKTEKVLAACPNQTWRTLFALARYGALRTPSESLALKWDDVHWAAGTFTVFAEKTRKERQVPLFPELRRELEASHLEAKDGAEFVVELHDGRNGRAKGQSAAVNLRTHFERVVRRAGVKPWPRLWQQLRASRTTELADRFGVETAATWSGHTVAVLLAHYKTNRRLSDHYAEATTESTEGSEAQVSQEVSQTAPDSG